MFAAASPQRVKAPAGRWTYRLNNDEWAAADAVTRIRNEKNYGDKNWIVPDMSREDAQAIDRRATGAEIAASRIYNVCWSGCGPGSDRRFDIGDCCEVRMVEKATYGLVSRFKDHDDAPIALIHYDTESLLYSSLGWEFAKTVRKNGVRYAANAPRPYYVLSQASLRPNEELFAWMLQRKGETCG